VQSQTQSEYHAFVSPLYSTIIFRSLFEKCTPIGVEIQPYMETVYIIPFTVYKLEDSAIVSLEIVRVIYSRSNAVSTRGE